MNVQKEFEKPIEEFVSRVLDMYGNSIERIILFGSVARKEGDSQSDIDLLVITREKNITQSRDICGIGFEVLLEYDYDISPKIYGSTEAKRLAGIKTPFFEEIERERRVIYETS